MPERCIQWLEEMYVGVAVTAALCSSSVSRRLLSNFIPMTSTLRIASEVRTETCSTLRDSRKLLF